jgi:hypothetical protein
MLKAKSLKGAYSDSGGGQTRKAGARGLKYPRRHSYTKAVSHASHRSAVVSEKENTCTFGRIDQ